MVAAADKFELLHTNALDDMAQATPAIVGDRLLVADGTAAVLDSAEEVGEEGLRRYYAPCRRLL